MTNKKQIKIKENSKTNCPNYGKKKNGKYIGWCYECTYPGETK
jgi:hypothetical protein